MNRRKFLYYGFLASIGNIPSASQAALNNNIWNQPRFLHMIRFQTNEEVNTIYHRNGTYHVEGYIACCKLLRDTQENKTIPMRPALLDLLWITQNWLSSQGYKEPLIIHSGYRTPQTNRTTPHAKPNSRHLIGGAADFSIAGIPQSKISQLIQFLSIGGVGVYPNRNLMHIDEGNARHWFE